MFRKTRMLTLLAGIALVFTGAFGQAGTAAAASAEGAPQIVLEDGRVLPVDAVDQPRGSDQLAVFTRHFGEKTPAFGAGVDEYIVADGVVVSHNANGAAGTFVPTTGYVLSASGTASEMLGQLAIGTTLNAQNIDIPVLPQKYFSVQGEIVGLDRVNGPRGAAEVVLYEPSFGPSTGTNPWGMEIAVSSGKVTRVVGIEADPATGAFRDNNLPIPADGYVISIQSASPFYDKLIGKVAVGDSADLVTNSLIYTAGKLAYDAYNPRSLADNPAAWDDTTGEPFPGYRGADQLIIYDSTYGTHTGTNPWGFEAVVNAQGFVIASGGNDSTIPEGGYVLSGHGVKNLWLTNHALVGAKVRIDSANKQVLVIFTPESYLDRADISIDNAEKDLQASKAKFLDVPYAGIEQEIAAARTLYGQAKTAIENGNTDGLFDLLNALDRKLTDAHFMNYESRKVDERGLWVRPKETNLQQVREHLQKMKNAHINEVYLETWWDGYTIYPTQIADTTQNPIYQGFDVLQAYLDEGKKLGINIHAWVENFFAGGPVVTNHPDWLMISRKGDNYEPGTYGAKWYWLNPALPQARDFVSSVYKELLTKYDVASLHLDYTRYPGSGDYTNDFGYDEYTRNLFKQQAGVDPIDLHPGDAHWEEWLQFRADIINTWVDRVVKEAHETRPGVLITAAVWPNYEEAPQSHAQETAHWAAKNEMDHILHMSYVPDATIIERDLKASLDISDGKSFISSGIGTFIDLTKTELVRQINAAVMAGADGTALFEFESLFDNGYDRELTLGVYRNEAVAPDYRKTKPVSVLLGDMVRKIDEIYVPFQGMSAQDAAFLKRELQSAIKKLDKDAMMDNGTAHSVRDRLQGLQASIAGSQGIQAEAKNRLNFDLNFALRMVNLYLVKTGKA
ncbi:glycoside hydrolase family 10 protein [Cohnella candidum]|uniref:Glycosyl hydrolase-like 10 domain-containing protein n=1 Tax=Cohnella candidum TaxID=2674991 RepID=A0A3G3K1K5_9BACL|nr:family 10 glycosylhydrolase [Cohnella candidum]AYQ74343.1 hypothetical protein EAV92_18275 [Cohnella candidum]